MRELDIAYICKREHEGKVWEVEMTVNVAYWPGCPPPPCSNPDSPAFSDPGSGPEFDILGAVVNCSYTDDEDDGEWLKNGDTPTFNFSQTEEEEIMHITHNAYESISAWE